MNAFELYRRMAGLSQAEAAAQIGVNQSAISQWENGKTEPRASLLPRIAEVYKTSVDKLLGQ